MKYWNKFFYYRLEREAIAAQTQSMLRPRPLTTAVNRSGAGDSANAKLNDDSKERTTEQIRLQRLNVNRKSMADVANTTPSKTSESGDGSNVARRLMSSGTPISILNNSTTSVDENGRIRYVRKVLPSQKSEIVVRPQPAVPDSTSKVYKTTGIDAPGRWNV